ncbi:hypothetical protein LC607_18075 [Nostoc sp. CHAB 5824]|nr:hypothetical protein [Nostoc sp. CHAB 5824]
MFFWIQDNQIVGTALSWIEPDSCPQDFLLVEGTDLPIEQMYWDRETILVKPPQPSNEHYWSNKTNAWEVPPTIAVPEVRFQDWDRLISLLDSSPEWGRVYTAAERTLKANTAFTTLLSTLTNFRKIETLEFAIAKLREAMIGISGVGDFTAEEIASINQKLADCGFELQLS